MERQIPVLQRFVLTLCFPKGFQVELEPLLLLDRRPQGLGALEERNSENLLLKLILQAENGDVAAMDFLCHVFRGISAQNLAGRDPVVTFRINGKELSTLAASTFMGALSRLNSTTSELIELLASY